MVEGWSMGISFRIQIVCKGLKLRVECIMKLQGRESRLRVRGAGSIRGECTDDGHFSPAPSGGANRLFRLPWCVPQVAGFRPVWVQIKDLKWPVNMGGSRGEGGSRTAVRWSS